MAGAATTDRHMWLGIGAVLCASFVGHGIGRFAYTPLVPLLITEGWFAPGAVAYLGAANLAGYLAGALLARPLATRVAVATLLRGMMLCVGVAFLVCAVPGPFLWFFLWRFLAGLAGGVLMVLGAPALLARLPPERHGLALGAVFAGVGFGITASGTLVPALLDQGLTATWIALGAAALAITALVWRWLPDRSPPPRPSSASRAAPVLRMAKGVRLLLAALALCYALNAVGLVPHMVFLVDYLARAVDLGAETGSLYWILFGIGAIVGPLAFGAAADRIGFTAMLRLAFLVQAGSVLLIVTGWTPALLVSTFVMGGFTPGIASIVLGRIHEIVGDEDSRRRAWSTATTAFAIGQAGAAYGFSWIFGATGGATALLFILAAAALLAAAAIEVLAAFMARRAGSAAT